MTNKRCHTGSLLSLFLKAELAEEERLLRVQNRTTGKKCRLYSLRAIISLFVTILLGGAVYAIIFAVEASTNTVSTLYLYLFSFCTRGKLCCFKKTILGLAIHLSLGPSDKQVSETVCSCVGQKIQISFNL